MPRCQAFGCSNEPSKTSGLSFYAIPDPLKDRENCRLWLNRIGIDKFDIRTYVFNKNRLVCEEHFEPECFANLTEYRMGFARRKILKEGAVPTIFSFRPQGKKRTHSEARRRSRSHKQMISQLLHDQPGPSQERSVQPEIFQDPPGPSQEPHGETALSPGLSQEHILVRDSDVDTLNIAQVLEVQAVGHQTESSSSTSPVKKRKLAEKKRRLKTTTSRTRKILRKHLIGESKRLTGDSSTSSPQKRVLSGKKKVRTKKSAKVPMLSSCKVSTEVQTDEREASDFCQQFPEILESTDIPHVPDEHIYHRNHPELMDFSQWVPVGSSYNQPSTPESGDAETTSSGQEFTESTTASPSTKESHDDSDNDDGGHDDESSSPFKDRVSDVSYEVSHDSSSSEEEEATEEQTILFQKKYIVFEDSLRSLFNQIPCRSCGLYADDVKEFITGSLLHVKLFCLNSHLVLDWKSQHMFGKVGAGNILASAAILFSGNTFNRISQFAEFLGVPFIGKTTFYNMQSSILNPIINQEYLLQQEAILNSLPSEGVRLSGDGRCDSPGYSAKYCTYSLMDMSSNKIVTSNVVQVTEASSSVTMEPLGFRRSVDYILSKEIKINIIATDRHPSITSIMKKDYKSIEHQHDVWHVVKSVKKS